MIFLLAGHEGFQGNTALSIKQIHELIRQGEDISTEFKTYRNKINRDVSETVCVFLNRHGGTLLFGALDDGVRLMLSSLMGNLCCVSMCRKARRCIAAMAVFFERVIKESCSLVPVQNLNWRLRLVTVRYLGN